jgi:antitoxin VapB
MSQVAKVFRTGRSQAVRIPAAFRFDTDEVFIHKDPATGDVILSSKPTSWDGFLKVLDKTDVPSDFLDRKDRNQNPDPRDPLEGLGD